MSLVELFAQPLFQRLNEELRNFKLFALLSSKNLFSLYLSSLALLLIVFLFAIFLLFWCLIYTCYTHSYLSVQDGLSIIVIGLLLSVIGVGYWIKLKMNKLKSRWLLYIVQSRDSSMSMSGLVSQAPLTTILSAFSAGFFTDDKNFESLKKVLAVFSVLTDSNTSKR
jgi:hypothetical protein